MIYTKEDINSFDKQSELIAISRYLHKIGKNETKGLLPHELEFICSVLPHIFEREDLTIPVYDIYQLPFLEEVLFKRLLLIYYGNFNFLKPVFNGHRELTDAEIERDKTKYNLLLKKWKDRLQNNSKSDHFFHEVKLEYNRKAKILKLLFVSNYFGRHHYERLLDEQAMSAFYIYFIVKSFFKNSKSTNTVFKAFNVNFSVNAYSYVHILSRHYMPYFNGVDTEKTFNGALENINPFELPKSLKILILDYAYRAPNNYILNEYMIFSQKADYYIIWWKPKKLIELGGELGYEVRTMYKVESKNDKLKINYDRYYQINDHIKYFY